MDPPRMFDVRVRLFISRLHGLIASRGRCFVSGSFVIEVPRDDSRFTTFVNQLTRFSSRRLISRTHDWFQKQHKFRAQRLCKTACAIDARTLRAGPQREYTFSPPLVGLCGSSDSAAKRVMLWYVFAAGSKTYMFVKLESHPGMSAHHLYGAIRRYVLKKKKVSSYAPRRENAKKDANGNVSAAAARASHEDVHTLWPSLLTNAQMYNRSVRTGMEMFVPADIARTL